MYSLTHIIKGEGRDRDREAEVRGDIGAEAEVGATIVEEIGEREVAPGQGRDRGKEDGRDPGGTLPPAFSSFLQSLVMDLLLPTSREP